MSKTSLAAIAVAVALYGTARADTAANGGWATRSELGFVMARGNTNAKSGNLKFDTAHVIGRWKYSYGLSALYAASNGIETAQRWDTHFQTDMQLSERAFWFGALRYEDDRFSGFAYQESFSTGAGRDFIKSDSTKLSAQLGVGWRRLRPELLIRGADGAIIQRIPSDKTDDAVADAALTFEHSFNPSTKVIDTLLVESGQSNTTTKENVSLQVRMNASLALAVGLQVRNNTNPPAGAVKRTDTLTTINLVYDLKNPKFTPSAASRLPGATAQAK
jgi:putative salt-induced outer membrane protein